MEQLPTSPGERPEDTSASRGSAYTASATISEQGIVTEWSEEASRLLGYVPAEVVGLPAAHLLADSAGDAARRIPPDQHRWSGTVALRHRDGRRLEVGLLAHRWTSTGGTAKWFVVSAVAGGPRIPWDEPLKDWAFTQSPAPWRSSMRTCGWCGRTRAWRARCPSRRPRCAGCASRRSRRIP
ncbi:PAS domain S-box protein [Streptomyces sp. MS1.HAVA.3]|uniref:PAS domain S-box protein n=1 Tax=Streptomyces caledonius TaxID=3134107 RepID=A0ABU8UEF5_9ACTN